MSSKYGIYISPYDRNQMEDIVLSYIHDAYRHRQSDQPEPSISATDVLDYLLQHGRCPLELRHATRQRQQTWVRSLLRTSVQGGRLETSRGASTRSKGEVRLYAPMSDTPIPA